MCVYLSMNVAVIHKIHRVEGRFIMQGQLENLLWFNTMWKKPTKYAATTAVHYSIGHSEVPLMQWSSPTVKQLRCTVSCAGTEITAGQRDCVTEKKLTFTLWRLKIHFKEFSHAHYICDYLSVFITGLLEPDLSMAASSSSNQRVKDMKHPSTIKLSPKNRPLWMLD